MCFGFHDGNLQNFGFQGFYDSVPTDVLDQVGSRLVSVCGATPQAYTLNRNIFSFVTN